MSHKDTARNPMSEARRQHIYGPLQPMDEPRTKPGTMPHFMAGLGDQCPEDRIPFVGKLLIVALAFAVVPLIIVAFS